MTDAHTPKDTCYDLLIIGGGINGTGIARDAAGRGLSVCLVEQNDLASATSSASTKLIHGGLRYLEHYEFRLVRESLMERETLMAMAPHIIWPLRFTLPHDQYQRPAWLIRLGLFLYDNLGGRKKLPGTKSEDLKSGAIGAPLQDDFVKGFTYSDCWVQDARLTVLNAMDARNRGAHIHTRTKFISGKRVDGQWLCEIQDIETGHIGVVQAKGLINAGGPWVTRVLEDGLGDQRKKTIRMIKGSHIVVPKKYEGDHCYIFQNPDGRIFFSIPYENDYTLIGTTDEEFKGEPGQVAISSTEVDYICRSASAYFKEEVVADDVVWTYSGVRPLYDDQSSNASAITRDYVLDLTDEDGKAPLLSIFGGKITTARKLAEHALEELKPFYAYKRMPWTDKEGLPGGDLPHGDLDGFIDRCNQLYSSFPSSYIERLVRHYGTRIDRILQNANSTNDLGLYFGADLYEAEIRYLMMEEWAKSAEDIIWRRTKLGLKLSPTQVTELEQWIESHRQEEWAAAAS